MMRFVGPKRRFRVDLSAEPLGSGTAGVVRLAYDAVTKRNVALKVFAPDASAAAADEALIVAQLRGRSEHIVECVHFFEATGLRSCAHRQAYMAMPLARGTLLRYTHGDSVTVASPALCARFARHLFDALAACAAAGLGHGDVKPENCLIYDDDDRLVLADFNLAGCIDDEVDSPLYTLWYRPPELLLNSERATSAADVWAAGVTLLELVRSAPMWPAHDPESMIKRVAARVGAPASWPDDVPAGDVREHWERCAVRDSAKRLSLVWLVPQPLLRRFEVAPLYALLATRALAVDWRARASAALLRAALDALPSPRTYVAGVKRRLRCDDEVLECAAVAC